MSELRRFIENDAAALGGVSVLVRVNRHARDAGVAEIEDGGGNAGIIIIIAKAQDESAETRVHVQANVEVDRERGQPACIFQVQQVSRHGNHFGLALIHLGPTSRVEGIGRRVNTVDRIHEVCMIVGVHENGVGRRRR